jgi:hypothetical protein
MDNVYPDDVESVEALLAELGAGKDIVGFECREVCADGSVRWFEWSTSSRPEAGIVYGVARDVTDRRMANAELSALRRIATLAAQGVAPLDLFAVVAEEVARVVDVPLLIVSRYESTVRQRSVPASHRAIPCFPTSGAARIDDYSQGSGLIGLTDRVEALGGRMRIVSPAGRGTSLDPRSRSTARERRTATSRTDEITTGGFILTRRPSEEVTHRGRAQPQLRHKTHSRTGRDQIGEILLVVGGDHYHRRGCRQPRFVELLGEFEAVLRAEVDVDQHDVGS